MNITRRNWFLTAAVGLILILLVVLIWSHQLWFLDALAPQSDTQLTVLATADLHGGIPTKLSEYVQRERLSQKNCLLVDAGDFWDIDNGDNSSLAMQQWFKIRNDNPNLPYRVPPIVSQMDKLNYDAVVLGNHEFVANDRNSLDELILDFADSGIPVLSANFYDSKGANYVSPYIIKKVPTNMGMVKVGILGLTIKEVGESSDARELKDLPQYKGAFVLRDIVQEVTEKKWPELLRYTGADIVIAVVHAGEESAGPNNPGNRIRALAQETDGIDAIVAAHTHVNVPEHRYTNKSGKTVIVTQPERYGHYIAEINLSLAKEKGKWRLIDKHSRTVKLE